MSDINFKSSSFGGFDRKEVATYLEEQSALAKKTEKALVDQIEELKRERKEIFSKCSTLEMRINELEKSLEKEHFERLSAVKAKEQAEFSYEKLSREVAQHESEYSEIFEKARRYDASKQMIAETLLQSQRDANIILENAKIKAKQLSAQLYSNIDVLLNRINTFKGSFSLISTDVQDIANNFKQMSDVITYVNNEIGRVDESLVNVKYDSMDLAFGKVSNAPDLDELFSGNKTKTVEGNKYIRNEENAHDEASQANTEYVSREEFNPKSPIVDNNTVLKEDVNKEDFIAKNASEKVKYVVQEGPPEVDDNAEVAYTEEKSPSLQLYVNEEYAEKQKSDNSVYVPPLHESVQKKRAVNISDILMKYSK